MPTLPKMFRPAPRNTLFYLALVSHKLICNHVIVTSWYIVIVFKLGDNCIQNFHLGRYIVGYTVGNLVLRRRVSGAVKRYFRTYIRRYTSPNENFEYGYPYSNALLTFSLQKTVKMYFVAPTSSGCQLHKK